VKAVDLIRAGMFPADPDFWPTLERARLLAIDDLGLEPLDARDYALACVVDLIDRRYDGTRKTIITTNLGTEAFRERYCVGPGVRMLRRIREVGRFIVVKAPPAEVA
jgi:DNA replication protein DnaC